MPETSIIPVEATVKAQESLELSQTYENYEIITADGYEYAGEDLKIIKSRHKELEALRKSITKPLDESKKRVMEFFKPTLARLKGAEGIVGREMVAWAREQERIRMAEEKRLREAQQKEASRLAALAAKAEARGDKKKATDFDNRAEEVAFSAPAVVPTTTKIAGLAMTKKWKYRIVDIAKLPREYMIPNEVMLGQMARSTKGLFKVEGVEFYSEDSIRGTR